MKKITYYPIGIIYSPHYKIEGTPIQPVAAKGIKGKVKVFEKYKDGLKSLELFSHLFLIYIFNKVKNIQLTTKPFLDNQEHGIFSVRAPTRPNKIGISIVRLEKIEGNILHVIDVDILDKSPLLDIKPFVPEFDNRQNATSGWMKKDEDEIESKRDDGRFKD
ncbi:MAG: hypothetical protein BAJALOKI2v1_110045 [Promethearchaeota archaeon]|nr:MAG: hypothetical protein BAJALOKI2v1_110045 [Candidatus Lokiarchaeota archaeon]